MLNSWSLVTLDVLAAMVRWNKVILGHSWGQVCTETTSFLLPPVFLSGWCLPAIEVQLVWTFFSRQTRLSWCTVEATKLCNMLSVVYHNRSCDWNLSACSLSWWMALAAISAFSSSDSLMQLFKWSIPNPVEAETGTTCLKVIHFFGIMSSGNRSLNSAGRNICMIVELTHYRQHKGFVFLVFLSYHNAEPFELLPYVC